MASLHGKSIGESGNSDRFYFLGLQNHCGPWLQPEIKRYLLLGRKAITNLESILKSRHYFANKCPYSQRYGVSRNHVQMWKLDHEKADCWRTDAFTLWCWRRLLKVPWTVKEIKPVNPKGNQSWIFIGRTDAEAEVPILWPTDVKSH